MKKAGKGLLRTMKGESNALADIVPVDIPVNIMITVAWYTAVIKPKSVLTYHATTGGSNPFTWGEIGKLLICICIILKLCFTNSIK